MVFSQYLCFPVCKVGSKLDSGQLGPGLWVGGPLDLYAICMTAWDDHPLLPFLEVSADPCPERFLDAGPAGLPLWASVSPVTRGWWVTSLVLPPRCFLLLPLPPAIFRKPDPPPCRPCFP